MEYTKEKILELYQELKRQRELECKAKNERRRITLELTQFIKTTGTDFLLFKGLGKMILEERNFAKYYNKEINNEYKKLLISGIKVNDWKLVTYPCIIWKKEDKINNPL